MRLRAFSVSAIGALLSGCLMYGPGTSSVNLANSVPPSAAAGIYAPKPAVHVKASRAVSETGTAPSYNVEKGCKAASVLADEGGYDSCLKLELDAKRQVAEDWRSYSVLARQECVPYRVENFPESYVELMICLEMKDGAKHSEAIAGVTSNGAAKHKVTNSAAKSVASPEETGTSEPKSVPSDQQP